MPTESTIASVKKTVTVRASVARAFDIFTNDFDSWWPRSHHIGSSPMKRAVVEGRQGGRCYSEHVDGAECQWGTVLAWEPPHRLLIAWQLDGDWKFEPRLESASEVEVRFTPEPDGRTRVALEHRHIERFGSKASSARAALDSENGWGGLLALYVERVEHEGDAR